MYRKQMMTIKNKQTKLGNGSGTGLTGEPDGPGGPLVPASPWKSKISVIHLSALVQSLKDLFSFDLVLLPSKWISVRQLKIEMFIAAANTCYVFALEAQT